MKRDRKGLVSGFSTLGLYLRGCMAHVAGGLFILIVFFLCAESLATEKPGESENIAATVNGVPIETMDLTPQVEVNLRKYEKYGMSQSNGELQKFLQMQALESLITTELIYQQAKKIKITDLDKRIAESLSHIDEKQKKGEEYSEQRMRQVITKKILIDEYLVQQKLKGFKVPQEEVIEYYKNNKEAFMQEERVKSRHVLVSVASDAKPEDKEAAYEKITEARKLLQEGKPFAEIAKEYSDCNSASSGGELGYHERGYMPKAYDGVAFSLDREKLSDIIETQHGYHIIEVLDQQPQGVQPYEEVEDFIWRYLNMQHQKQAMDEHISALRKKAKIDIFL